MLDIQFIGPPLDAGPLSAVFYFALSAHHSLFIDPFNQPALALQNPNLRIFSITLPGHDIFSPSQALQFWAKEFKEGRNLIDSFINEVIDSIQTFYDKNIISSCAVMGLSRGVFIASHVAAKMEQIHSILGFAPLTRLTTVSEFQNIDVSNWDLTHLSAKLYNKKIRCYIGNRDLRVGTDNCFNWINQLASKAYEQGIRSSPIELRINPSIGKDGHGTSSEIFHEGAQWLLGQMRGQNDS